MFLAFSAIAQPILTNYTTSIYASVRDPLALSFGSDGTLYVARDNYGSGGGNGDAVKVHRIAPDASPVTEFGDAISDPDALIVDLAGTVSGTAGSVLVGGVHNNGSTGKIVKIAPDGSTTTLFGPNSTVWNPSDFAFDQAGRLLITEINNGKVLVTTGGAPVVLFPLANVHHIAVDALNRIVADTSDGSQLRLYTSEGVLSSANFASVKPGSPVTRGPGGAWGTDLYAVAPNGNLLRLGLDGATNSIGSGFLVASGGPISDIEFGPDGALYASDYEADRIYRFAQPQVPGAQTSIYARVTDPVRLTFAPDGNLFVGRDNHGSGGDWDDAVKIHRVGPGGTPVAEYGVAPITDPDAAVYDADGSASGVPGGVIVAGHQLNIAAGKIVVVRPDQTITTLYGPTTFTFNPNVFTYDLDGRLLFSDDEGGKVWTMTNGVPIVLFNQSGALHLVTDSLNRIVLGVSGSPTLRLYSGTGSLLNNAFATIAVDSPLARGPGGFWGTGVFCVSTNGDLLSLDTEGTATKRGTGLGSPYAMDFGPDGALYVSEFNSDLIWRIVPADDLPRLAIARAGDIAQLSWSSVSTRTYQLQSASQMPPDWVNEGLPFPGTGNLMTTNLPIVSGPRFYRLKLGD
jgi:hypothetical protein